MITILSALLILIVLFALELIYFKIAAHYHIIDKPNARSSHNKITLRGGGVIFSLSCIIYYFFYGFAYPFFMAGLLIITIISFLDDLMALNSKLRLGVHFFTVLLLFCQWNSFDAPWYWLLIACVFVIGTINAYNFIDGINGITGGYSLIALVTLYYLNEQVMAFTNSSLIILVGLSLVVFNFFNFRTKAKCFAGDVGSVSIAFILVFFIGQLIITSQNLSYILLLFFYGIDTASTLFFRKIRKENILEPHRSHFYQFLANEKKWPQLSVASLYMLLQLAFNVLLIVYGLNSLLFVAVATTLLTIVFIATRFWLEGTQKLMKR